MEGTTDINIVLGQADAIKEVHSVRKQTLESSQQFMAQETKEKSKREKEKVKEFEPEKRIDADAEKQQEADQEGEENGRGKKQSDKESSHSEGTLIDIKV
jgi:hypothetical protein